MIHPIAGADVQMLAPNGSPIVAALDEGETAYYGQFALVETPAGAYTVERDVDTTEFLLESARPSTRNGRRLYLSEDGNSYTLDELTITDTNGQTKHVTALPELAPKGDAEYLRRCVQDALEAIGWPRLDVYSFALGIYLGEGLPPEQALPLAKATKREHDAILLDIIRIDIRDAAIPWRQPLPTD